MEIDHNVFRNGIYPIATWGGPPDNLNVHDNVFDGIEDVTCSPSSVPPTSAS